jgi:hypothetical protein
MSSALLSFRFHRQVRGNGRSGLDEQGALGSSIKVCLAREIQEIFRCDETIHEPDPFQCAPVSFRQAFQPLNPDMVMPWTK